MNKDSAKKCPFCNSAINEFSERQKQILRNEVNSFIIPALIHDSNNELKYLVSINERHNMALRKDTPANELFEIQRRYNESIKNLDVFFSTLRELYFPRNYYEKIVSLKELSKKMEWLSSIFRYEDTINYAFLNKTEFKINIEEYWNLFLYAFHCLSISTRRSRNPNTRIDFEIIEQSLITTFTINQNMIEFNSNELWSIFISLCDSINANPVNRSDDQSSIIQWSHQLINN